MKAQRHSVICDTFKLKGTEALLPVTGHFALDVFNVS